MYFCYLIKSNNDKYLNDTYIGFTDDPMHRLRQHNGEISGGAKYTSRRRPWEPVLVVANFPNKILALKFEWAWQNPFQSNFIKDKIEEEESQIKRTKAAAKKYYNSIDFKLKVFNILISSKVFEKIYFYVFPFSEIGERGVQQKSNLFIERVNISNFKETLSKKVFHYESEHERMSIEEEENIPYSDKCIICDEEISDTNQIKKEEKESEEFEFDEDKSKEIESKGKIISCPFCKSKFHLLCLADNSIQNSGNKLSLIPGKTKCLICLREFLWNEWIKNISDN